MDNKYINIMTSCDEKLAKQLPVLLQSIADNITTHPVKFFWYIEMLLQRRLIY